MSDKQSPWYESNARVERLCDNIRNVDIVGGDLCLLALSQERILRHSLFVVVHPCRQVWVVVCLLVLLNVRLGGKIFRVTLTTSVREKRKE